MKIKNIAQETLSFRSANPKEPYVLKAGEVIDIDAAQAEDMVLRHPTKYALVSPPRPKKDS
jgi:hypothetical protein